MAGRKKMSPDEMASMEANATEACALLKTMANETRLMILCELGDGERSVGELLDIIPLSQSAVSQHLAMLRRENLVTTRREAQSILYSLASDEVRAIIGTLYVLFCEKSATKKKRSSVVQIVEA